MCRNIRQLHNFEPAATSDEVRAAALQYVRKVSGSTKPSQANQAAFDRAVEQVAHITEHLLADLVTPPPPKDREIEAAKARERSANEAALGRRGHWIGAAAGSGSAADAALLAATTRRDPHALATRGRERTTCARRVRSVGARA